MGHHWVLDFDGPRHSAAGGVVSCACTQLSRGCLCVPGCHMSHVSCQGDHPVRPAAPTLRVNTVHPGGRPHASQHCTRPTHSVTNESCSHHRHSPAVLRSKTTLHCGPPLKANMDQHFRSITDKWIDAGCVHKVEHRFIIDCSHPSNLS